MKIQACDSTTKKPLSDTRIQIQVKGKDSGYSSFTTDSEGFFDVDDQLRGQQIGFFLQDHPSAEWVTASEGAKLMVDSKQSQTREDTVKGESQR